VKAARFHTSTASGLLDLSTVFAATTNLFHAGMSTLGIVDENLIRLQ
jgi:hypothetical protein